MLTKSNIIDKIEIVGKFNHIQIREATVIEEDGKELTRSYHRRVLAPDADVSKEPEQIQGIAKAVWTDEIKTAYAENLKQSVL